MNKKHLSRLIASILLSLVVLACSTLPLPPVVASAAPQPAATTTTTYLPIVSKPGTLYDWLQFNGDPSHSGSNTLEKTLSPTNVSQLHLLFQVALPAVADGAPVYLSNVTTAGGIRSLVFLTLRTGGVVALDASSGATVWVQPSHAPSCLINNNLARNEACYTTSSPVLDPDRQYVYSYGLDGFVHKFKVADGTEILAGGWPELASLKVYDEKGSSALSLATAQNGQTYLYVTNGGYPGDAGNYQGHLTAINLADGTQKVFNVLCSDQTVHFVDSRVASGPDCPANTQAAIWARPGVVYDPITDRIYMSTGNGDFTPASFNWGETVFALHPDGSGAGNGNPLDSFTPTNFQTLTNTDADLGSTAPALLPANAGKYPHLAVQGGKDSLLRLLNLDNLSGQGQVGQTGGEVFSMASPMGGQILTQPAVWVNPADGSTWVFVSSGSGMAGLAAGAGWRRESQPAVALDGWIGHLAPPGKRRAVLCPQRADLCAQPNHREPALVQQPGRRDPLAEPGRRQWRALPGRSKWQPDRLFAAIGYADLQVSPTGTISKNLEVSCLAPHPRRADARTASPAGTSPIG